MSVILFPFSLSSSLHCSFLPSTSYETNFTIPQNILTLSNAVWVWIDAASDGLLENSPCGTRPPILMRAFSKLFKEPLRLSSLPPLWLVWLLLSVGGPGDDLGLPFDWFLGDLSLERGDPSFLSEELLMSKI